MESGITGVTAATVVTGPTGESGPVGATGIMGPSGASGSSTEVQVPATPIVVTQVNDAWWAWGILAAIVIALIVWTAFRTPSKDETKTKKK